MLKDRTRNYYLNLDYNCAEAILLAANDEYRLGIAPEDIKLVGGFGKGMGCEHVCGALCSSIAVIGKLHITQRAHATTELHGLCSRCVQDFQRELGTDNCAALRENFFSQETRCLDTVLKAAEVLEKILADNK